VTLNVFDALGVKTDCGIVENVHEFLFFYAIYFYVIFNVNYE